MSAGAQAVLKAVGDAAEATLSGFLRAAATSVTPAEVETVLAELLALGHVPSPVAAALSSVLSHGVAADLASAIAGAGERVAADVPKPTPGDAKTQTAQSLGGSLAGLLGGCLGGCLGGLTTGAPGETAAPAS